MSIRLYLLQGLKGVKQCACVSVFLLYIADAKYEMDLLLFPRRDCFWIRNKLERDNQVNEQ